MTRINIRQQAAAHVSGQRLDRVAADLFPDYSRSRIQQWIRQGQLTVDGVVMKASARLAGGEWLQLSAMLQADQRVQAQDIPLQVLYQDEALLVINKPAGLVVHPAAGNPDGTLQNGLLHFDASLAEIPRAGIVHRLDKDTSGVMMVARSLTAHHRLVEALSLRQVKREYRALVWGEPVAGGTVDAPIGRHPRDRLRMAVVAGGKPAVTHYRIRRRYAGLSWLQVQLETGRTHQIRVHMAHIGHALVGDALYGGRRRSPKGMHTRQQRAVQGFSRQALHAHTLSLGHPVSGESISVTAPLPQDLTQLLHILGEA